MSCWVLPFFLYKMGRHRLSLSGRHFCARAGDFHVVVSVDSGPKFSGMFLQENPHSPM